MDWTAISQLINWRTTGFAAAYLLCNIVGYFVPSIQGICGSLESIAVAGGLISAADAGRVQNIVRAVDTLLVKNNVDAATLAAVAPGGLK